MPKHSYKKRLFTSTHYIPAKHQILKPGYNYKLLEKIDIVTVVPQTKLKMNSKLWNDVHCIRYKSIICWLHYLAFYLCAKITVIVTIFVTKLKTLIYLCAKITVTVTIFVTKLRTLPY